MSIADIHCDEDVRRISARSHFDVGQITQQREESFMSKQFEKKDGTYIEEEYPEETTEEEEYPEEDPENVPVDHWFGPILEAERRRYYGRD